MATVNFSVPERVKTAFNETFKERNKSAIIAGLMQEAIEREYRRILHIEAMDSILKRHAAMPLPPVAPKRSKERRYR